MRSRAAGGERIADAVIAEKRGLPIIPIAVIVAVVTVACIVLSGVFSHGRGAANSSMAEAASTVDAPSMESASGEADSQQNALTEDNPNRISPKEDIAVGDLTIQTDSQNRYYITGSATNKSNQSYDVELNLSAIRHSSDKYGEEKTERSGFAFDTIAAFTEASGHTLKLYDMQPAETREFTLYPSWNSVEESYTDVTADVDEVKLPDAQAEWRYDHDDGIKITDLTYSADGKVVGKFINNTGLYLDEVSFVVLPYNNDLPMVDQSGGERPCGTVLYSGSANTLKPGDEGQFEIEVGEGHSKVEVVHVLCHPDREKGSWS